MCSPGAFAPDDRVQISGGAPAWADRRFVTQVMPAKRTSEGAAEFFSANRTTVETGIRRAGEGKNAPRKGIF